MNIGQASKSCGLPTQTIRYYETIGLVVADRRDNGYRYYTSEQLNKLRFLRRARSLGFSIAECRKLLSLYQDKHRTHAEVRRLAEARLVDVDREIEELQGMHDALSSLIESCHGDDRHDFAILSNIESRAGGSC